MTATLYTLYTRTLYTSSCNINITPLTQQKWASEELPEFKQSMWSLYNDCTALATRILELMGVGLNLEVRDTLNFVRARSKCSLTPNSAITGFLGCSRVNRSLGPRIFELSNGSDLWILELLYNVSLWSSVRLPKIQLCCGLVNQLYTWPACVCAVQRSQDPHLFTSAHRDLAVNSITALRSLYYPPLPASFGKG